MATFITLLFCLLLILVTLHSSNGSASTTQTYIVRLRSPDTDTYSDNQSRQMWHSSFLSALTKPAGISEKLPTILHSYHHVFHGFAARLTPEQAEEMRGMEGIISARPEIIRSLQTTHSPSFLGLHQGSGLWRGSNYGKGTIIGILDTGIKPDHLSFRDNGMAPPPAKWTGSCHKSVRCNDKLIGAKSFVIDSPSPIDEDGHGTHVAGTAAGNFVPGANVYGNANGTAAGVAPFAHLAVYKVCSDGCPDNIVLAGIDAAIADGVDVISMSLGGGRFEFFEDNMAIGAFSAMKRGIFVSMSAGNAGPLPSTLSNTAPWYLTVGASTTDRKLTAVAVLGNDKEFTGEAVFQPKNFKAKQFPLIYPGLKSHADRFCNTSLHNFGLRGKIVLCVINPDIAAVAKHLKKAGATGIIILNMRVYGYSLVLQDFVLPTTYVSFTDGENIVNYVKVSQNPTAAIRFDGAVIGDVHAPSVSYFSSRGPNSGSPGILKPDIVGPGVNILAAWFTSVEGNQRQKSPFNILSGTSMSCPHLSGVAALLKSAHPSWSPAAIKSAMMTTAYQNNLGNTPIQDETSNAANVYAIGAGHVDPAKASDPGLVYDTYSDDYVPYLCGLNYTSEQVSEIVSSRVDCETTTAVQEAQLNLPSISIQLQELLSSVQRVTRTLTSVGAANEFYNVQVFPPPGVAVVVEPSTLYFSKLTEQWSYEMTFTRILGAANGTSEGYLVWRSKKHSVRSPIVVELSGVSYLPR